MSGLFLAKKFYMLQKSLRETCLYTELFWFVFSRIRLNTERYSVFLCIQFECGIMQPRIFPNTYTFYAVNNSEFFIFFRIARINGMLNYMHTFLWATLIWKYLQIEQTINFEFSVTEALLANPTIFFSTIGQILDLKVTKFLCIILLIFTIFVRVSRPTFMLYLYDLFLTVIFIFIMINFIISWIQTQMLFCFFF